MKTFSNSKRQMKRLSWNREVFKSLHTGQGERVILLDLLPKLKSWRSSKHDPFITATGVQYLTVMPLAYVYERTGFFLLLPLFFFFWRLGKLRKVEKVVLAWQPELLTTNWIMGCFGIKDLSFVYGSGKSSLTSFGWNCNAVFQAKQILQKHLNLSLRRKDSVLNDE